MSWTSRSERKKIGRNDELAFVTASVMLLLIDVWDER